MVFESHGGTAAVRKLDLVLDATGVESRTVLRTGRGSYVGHQSRRMGRRVIAQSLAERIGHGTLFDTPLRQDRDLSHGLTDSLRMEGDAGSTGRLQGMVCRRILLDDRSTRGRKRRPTGQSVAGLQAGLCLPAGGSALRQQEQRRVLIQSFPVNTTL